MRVRPSLPPDSAQPRPGARASSAVVSKDDLLGRRIRDALAQGDVRVVDSAAEVKQLSEHAAAAATIVVAGCLTANAQRLTIRAVRDRFPFSPCVLVGSVSSTGVRRALDAGAAGVVLESDIETALAATLRAVLVHQLVVPGRCNDAIRPPLTHREKEALTLVARGLTNRQIGARLYLSESTVKTHLASVFAKLGVASRSEATALVLDPNENLGLDVVDVGA